MSALVVGGRYEVKPEARDGKYQYTSCWRESGKADAPYLKDAIFEVVSIDSDGDAKGYVINRATGKRTVEVESYVSHVEFDMFQQAGAQPQPKAPVQNFGELLGGGNGLQLPLMDSTEATHGLATMFASLIMGAIGSDEVLGIINNAVKEVATQKIPRPLEVTFSERKNIVEVAHKQLNTVLDRLRATKNLMLVGEAGCGKTFLAGQVAQALGLNFSSVSCSSDMSSSVLLGRVLPDKTGAWTYRASEFINIYENGGVFLLDELDSADPSILLVLNQALANGQIVVSEREDNPVVKRHPEFICFAACNTFGRGGNLMYSGRERLDESTLDRFRAGLIEMHYDEDLERKLVDDDILAWGHGVRSRIEECKLKRVLSTRFLIDATALKNNSQYSLQDIKDVFFTGWKDDEKSRVDR